MTSTFRDWYGEPPTAISGQLKLDAESPNVETEGVALHTTTTQGAPLHAEPTARPGG